MNLMLPDSGLLFWMTIIFAVVFLILAKFGFPIITGMVEKRTKRIDDAIGAAREAESRLRSITVEQERIINEANAEQNRILKEAAHEREKMIISAQDQARAEAEKILEEAREKIREEKEAALRDIRREVAVLSVAIAEKVVRKELSTSEGQKDMVDRIFDELS